ncbi:MAG TPA: hypothetical protein VGL83_16710 [Stellaceae bacterium]|jgi:hypothetical protein
MPADNPALVAGKEMLARGNPAGAIACFLRALATDRESAAKVGLTLCYALCGRLAEMTDFVIACEALPAGRIALLQTVLLELVAGRAWETISRIAEAFAGDAHLRALAIYYVGVAKLARHDDDAAWPCFQEFKAIVIPRHREFPLVADEHFNLIFRQACMVEPPDSVAEILAATKAPATPTVELVGEWRESGAAPVFLCCCDRRYFRRFGAELCQSLADHRPNAVLHFHIAGPQEADLEFARRLALRCPLSVLNVTVERTPLFSHPVYYACNRFLVLPQLLERYRRPIMSLDADSILLGGLHEIVEAAQGFDFACFNTGRNEPSSVFQATILYFAATPGARRLLDILGCLVLAKLGMPPVLSWMLDQGALYSAIHYAKKYAPEIAVIDLAAATGRDMRSFIGGLGTADEKRNIMNAPAAA